MVLKVVFDAVWALASAMVFRTASLCSIKTKLNIFTMIFWVKCGVTIISIYLSKGKNL